jgi:DNA-directed RNA polymerase subunit alpha
MGLSLGMKIDENGNPVPGPTSVLPAATLAASYGAFDDEDEEDEDFEPVNETETF